MILNSKIANDYFAKRRPEYKSQICRIASAKITIATRQKNKKMNR